MTVALESWHGTVTGYVRHGCRLDCCRKALATYTAERRELRRALLRTDRRTGRQVAIHDHRGRLLPHGENSTYTNWLCRCAPCTSAASARPERTPA